MIPGGQSRWAFIYQKIFGSINNLECRCGMKHGKKDLGVVCGRCGITVTLRRCRRERMGHIKLAVPVCHIWFFKGPRSYIGLVLGIGARELERVIYYDAYLVLDGKNTPLERHQVLSEEEYFQAVAKYGEASFVAKMGAAAVRDALSGVDLQQTAIELQQTMSVTTDHQVRKTLGRRIELLSAFHTHNVRPEWMILTVLPVIPPDLRPLVPLPDGSYVRNDVNDLYRQVIAQNLKLRSLLERRRFRILAYRRKAAAAETC